MSAANRRTIDREAKRLARLELEVANARHNVGPLPAEQREGFAWLDLELPEGHGLGRLDVAVLRYVASLDLYVRRTEPGRLGCWTTLDKMGRVGRIVAAYRAEKADPKISTVPARRLRSVFRKLAPHYVVTENDPRAAGGKWVSTSRRRFVAVDLADHDPTTPVVVPLPPKVSPGRGGARWSPTKAGQRQDEKGRWTKLTAPSKVSPDTVKSVHGEARENAGRKALGTVKGVASTSSHSQGGLAESPTETLVRCAHDLESQSERTKPEQPDKISCPDFCGPDEECRSCTRTAKHPDGQEIQRTDRNGQDADKQADKPKDRHRESLPTEATSTTSAVGAPTLTKGTKSRDADTHGPKIFPDLSRTTRAAETSAPAGGGARPEPRPEGSRTTPDADDPTTRTPTAPPSSGTGPSCSLQAADGLPGLATPATRSEGEWRAVPSGQSR